MLFMLKQQHYTLTKVKSEIIINHPFQNKKQKTKQKNTVTLTKQEEFKLNKVATNSSKLYLESSLHHISWHYSGSIESVPKVSIKQKPEKKAPILLYSAVFLSICNQMCTVHGSHSRC